MPTVGRGTQVRCTEYQGLIDLHPGAEGFVEWARNQLAKVSWYQMRPDGREEVFITMHSYPFCAGIKITHQPAEK